MGPGRFSPVRPFSCISQNVFFSDAVFATCVRKSVEVCLVLGILGWDMGNRTTYHDCIQIFFQILFNEKISWFSGEISSGV